jgi:glycosyltransferase involved in cell wall biosynthesis
LRIGILAPPWDIPPRDYGGLENAIDVLARAFKDAGHEVYLWSSKDSTCPVHVGGTLAAELGDAPWHSAPEEVDHVIRGYTWLRDCGVDIIHDHTYVGPLLSGSVSQIPVVVTNSLPFAAPVQGATHPDMSEIYRHIARTLPVIALTNNHAKGATFPVASVIAHGTDFGSSYPGGGGGDEVGKYVAILGRMAEEKGIAESITAAVRSGIRVKVAARMEEPGERAYFRERVEPLLRKGIVEFIGVVGPSERTRFLRNASCMVNLIKWPEPFGLVMIEAMATGTPVVGTALGSIPELVTDGQTGYIADRHKDPSELISKAGELDRSRVWETARLSFDSAVCAQNHLSFYRKIIEKGIRA